METSINTLFRPLISGWLIFPPIGLINTDRGPRFIKGYNPVVPILRGHCTHCSRQNNQPGAAMSRVGTTRVKPPNRHLGYVIPWYGLALALLGVYGFFLYSNRRKSIEDEI